MKKLKIAQDKLASWKKVQTVEFHNESFLKIIIDVPNISTEEVIDRYMKGIKPNISRELCATTYDSVTKLVSDALSIEASKTFFRSFDKRNSNIERSDPVPIDISNTKLRLRGGGFRGQMRKDYERNLLQLSQKKLPKRHLPGKEDGE